MKEYDETERLKQQEYEKLEDKCQEKETQIEALDDTAKEMKQDIESKVRISVRRDEYCDSSRQGRENALVLCALFYVGTLDRIRNSGYKFNHTKEVMIIFQYKMLTNILTSCIFLA